MIKKLILVISTLLGLGSPFLAAAQLATIEANPLVVSNVVLTGTQSLLQHTLMIAVEALKKRLLDTTVDQIVNYVQGGGEPKFITDWEGFFRDAANAAVGDLALEVAPFLCTPFNLQVRIAVLQPPPFSRQIVCTLDQIVANIENFYNDFRNGGFIAYQELWQPQNNFYGALLLAWDQTEKRRANRLFTSYAEAMAGQGFLSVRRCDEFGHCVVVTPGTVVGATVAKAVGSDIDYVVNSRDLAAYVAAISDAFVNRLIREGVGLLGVSTPKSPPRGFLGTASREPCAGLIGPTLQDCLNYQQISRGNFEASQAQFVSQIDATLLPRLNAKHSLEQAVAQENFLIDKLGALAGCQAHQGQNIESGISQSRLAGEQSTLNQLQKDLIANDKIVNPLENAKLQLQNPPEKTYNALTNVFYRVNYLLDAPTAAEFQQAKRNQEENIKNYMSQQFLELRPQLDQCQIP